MTVIKTDKYGFPLEECERCNGTGEHSFHILAGSRCFDCGGSGFLRTSKAKREYLKWLQAVEACRATRSVEMQVGDKISVARHAQSRRNEWATVVKIEHASRTADEEPFASGSTNGVLQYEWRERWLISYVLKDGVEGCLQICDPELTWQVFKGADNEPKPDGYVARSLAVKVRA